MNTSGLFQETRSIHDSTNIPKLEVISKIIAIYMEHLALSLFVSELGDNCIQNFYLGRYIVGYTVGNLCQKKRPITKIKLIR